jgi:hypothetical protein
MIDQGSYLQMAVQVPQGNSTVIPVSFGIGLLLAGRYVLGAAAIVIGAVAYFRANQFKEDQKHETHWNDLSYKEKLSSIDTWYYSKDGNTVGPLGEGAILHLFKNNKITKETFIYNSVISNEWIPFEQTHLYRNHIDKS